MKKNFNMTKYNTVHRQQGAATLTILLFVGVAISIAVLGSFRYIRGSQSQSMALHAQTQAQRTAWAGVDITKKYLSSLDSTQLETLVTSIPIKVEPGQVQQKLNATIDDPNLQLSIYKENVIDKIYLFAEVTGETAKKTRANATSTIEAIFELKQGTTQSSKSCVITRTAVIIGASDFTGGGTDFLSGDALSDIAIEGNLKLSSSSKSGISGCVSGDVYMNGGGIKNDANLLVGGRFTVESMSPPVNAGVWAKEIIIGNTGSASYNFLRAGAYTTVVLDSNGNNIGTGIIGGKLLDGTTSSSTSWVAGTLIPTKEIPFVVEMTSGERLLVDLSEATIDETNGFVKGHVVEALEGTKSLPAVLKFKATSVTGGDIDVYSLEVNQLWGHDIVSSGYGANYQSVLSNGHFSMGTGDIGLLVGGGNLTASQGGCSSSSNCWNTPNILNPSEISGIFTVGNFTGNIKLNNLTQQTPNLSPGLPGIPFCDTRVDEVVAADFKSSANYIFEVVNQKRQLTVQNVMLANGTKLDGVYDLSKDDLRSLHSQSFLSCGWGNAHCFRDYDVWELNGVSAFPPGIAWFDSSLKIAGVGSNYAVNGIGKNLLNTIIATGSINLTSSGHGDLIAPNFNPQALCQGDIVPTNLCTQDGKLIGNGGSGLPIANTAILSQSNLSASGWAINGHVTLGGGVQTSGSKVTITGALVVGSNNSSYTTVGSGGLEVNTQNLTQEQLQTTCSNDDENNSLNGWQLKQSDPVWTRYL
ncbi:hypothetical protein [Pseudoalteromonas sp. NGC95]|uniref:hypothetical protein n=1 Tax=Pseudoalteromonas sp. NGC95 TaxID=2792051 RepID=UPI0018CF1C10|nr:hypothetical protein [Pseudoalteromonas sp. NGC95]MBH0017916.1 hypothetical protein [Pseudoalteromonas sp. NGC95]